jgi:hypothetical protein
LSESIKKKVSGWLKEEGFFYREITDPDTYFNFSIKVAGAALDVVKDISRDVVLVRSNLVLTDGQMITLRSMSEKSREDFFWEVRSMLLRNNEVGAFQIKPDAKNVEVFVQARGIFQGGLSKDRLMQSILVVHKSITMVVWLLERNSGKIKSAGDSLYM